MANANIRQRVMAALGVIRAGEDATALKDYMSDEDAAAAELLFQEFLSKDCSAEKVERVVREAVASEKFSSLAEVHPAWILEKLREESPRVIGIILRSLPSKHVRFILNNLPPMLRAKLPNMVESFAVANPILEVIRRRFERHFLPMPVSRSMERFGFENIYYLKADELLELIRELGLNELAMALQGMPSKTLFAIYNRLGLKDAKRLQKRIREIHGVSPKLFKQACYSVLEIEGAHIGPDRMLINVGLKALASAIAENEERFVRLLMQRMEPIDGYLFKRFIEERRLRQNFSLIEERQKMVLSAVAFLAEEGRIDPSFGQCLPSETASIPLSSPSSASLSDEETASVVQ